MNEADKTNTIEWQTNGPVADHDFNDDFQASAPCGRYCYHRRNGLPCPVDPWA